MKTGRVKLKIKKVGNSKEQPLLCGDEGYAKLYLDLRDGEVWLDGWPQHCTGWTGSEADGYVLSWHVDRRMTPKGCNALFSDDEVLELLKKIYVSAQGYWETKKLNREAEQASELLQRVVEEPYSYEILVEGWEIVETYGEYEGCMKEGGTLEEVAKNITKTALDDCNLLAKEEEVLEALREDKAELERRLAEDEE